MRAATPQRPSVTGVVLALAVFLASEPSQAFVSREAPIVAASGRQPRLAPPVIPARDAPAGWTGTRDRDTGVVLQLWGSHVDAPGAMADPAIAERAARAFLAAHLALLAPGAAISDFVVVANQVDGQLRTVGFQQTWRGLRVVGGQLHVVFAHDRLFVAGSAALPEVHAAIPRDARKVSSQRAEAWVTAQTGLPVVTRKIGARVVLPIVYGPGDIAYYIADELDIASTTTPGEWDVYLDAAGTPLLRASKLRFAASTLRYDVGDRRPTGTRHDVAVDRANITVDGAGTTTGSDGAFTWTGASPATVVPGLAGTLVRILNSAGELVTTQLTAQPGQPVRWSLATDETGDAQLATYVYGMIAKARARQLSPALASWLDVPLDFNVNVAGDCNASSNGNEVFLFRASAMCENTGRLADVVFHEFGHSIHFHSVIAGAGAYEPSLGEGLADFNAANIVEDHGVGRGFFFDDTPLRDLDPSGSERVWPADQSSDPHLTGLIIGGALWDLRKALIAQLGHDPGVAASDAVFVGILQRAASIPTSYVAALTADDDDGDLGNGTPHGCAIENAFGKHGLASAGFMPTVVGTPIVDGLAITVPVTVPTGGTCPRPIVTGVAVAWSAGAGPPSTVDFVSNGASWTGAIPPQPDGTVVRYTVTASLDDGSSVRYPDNPADPEYQLYVGPTTPIWCEQFDADPRWTQTGSGEWEWAVPGVSPQSGDPSSAHTGTHVLGTDVTQDGRYLFGDQTEITTPPIDVSMYEQVRLQYWRWLTVEDALYDHATITANGHTVWTNAKGPLGTLDHIDKEWRFHDLDVTAQAGEQLQLAWGLESDQTRQLGGWTLDDVCLVGIGRKPVTACGDGVLDEDEACDDGNLADGDGCSAACVTEVMGDAGCCSTGTDPGGPMTLGLGVLVALRRRPRQTRPRA